MTNSRILGTYQEEIVVGALIAFFGGAIGVLSNWVWGQYFILLTSFSVLFYVLLFSKGNDGNFKIFDSLLSYSGRTIIYITTIFSFFAVLIVYNINESSNVNIEVVSSIIHPDSGLVIYSEDLNNRKTSNLDIRFNGIEFENSAKPHKRGEHYWKFTPHREDNIPDNLIGHGKSTVQVGVNDRYYTDIINVYADSSIGVDTDDRKVDLLDGWNIISFQIDDSMSVKKVFSPIKDVIAVVKDERGRPYMPGRDIDLINFVKPDRGYKVYSTKDTSFYYPNP